MPKYYPINEEAARRAKTPTAFPTMFPAPPPPLTVKWWIGPIISDRTAFSSTNKWRFEPVH